MSPFMVITSKKGWKKQLERKVMIALVALAAFVTICMVSQSAGYPTFHQAFAQQDQNSSLLQRMLNSSQTIADAKMVELQSMDIPIPPDVIDLYSLAITEKSLALASIEGDLESAKLHTLSAMTLFKQTADMANNQGLVPMANDEDVINEHVGELQNDMAKLKKIIDVNKLSFATNRDVAEFDQTLGRATLAVIQNDYAAAEEQLSRCELILDSVNEKIHSETERLDRSGLAKAFVDTLAERLEQLINEAQEMGLSKEDVLELANQRQMILDQLKKTDDFESIIELADQLKEKEYRIQVIIEELTGESTLDKPVDEPKEEEPVDDGPSGGGSSNDSPLPDEPPTYDPSKFEEEYMQLQDEIAELKTKVESVGLTFPSQDTDEMLAHFKQHADNGEDEEATQAMEELYDYLSMVHGVKASYLGSTSKLESVTEVAEDLQAQVMELNYLQFMPRIDDSFALLSDADSNLAFVAADDGLSYSLINSATDHIDQSNELIAQADIQLEETQALLDELIAQVEETLALIEQEEARADEIEDGIPNIISPLINDILGLLDQARGLLADARESLQVGELQQAQQQLDDASSLLDDAEDLLTGLLDLLPLL
jgi:hypothetical protein